MEAQKLFGIYNWEELQKAVVYVKQAWLLAKSTQTYSRFDAVNNKYKDQTLVNIKTMWPPSVTQSVISNWFYLKEVKLEMQSEPMEIC